MVTVTLGKETASSA